ncbi:MAG: DedA family protein [Bacteriovoracaceae bacterium]|nr:DedA family protein [Bacteriovoracaceae bacterium]
MFSEDAILQFFSSYAYEPTIVYLAVFAFMVASAFGFPVPEEVTLVTVALIAHMANNPSIYPPPYEGAVGVNVLMLSIVCVGTVVLADVIIYFIGKKYGKKILRMKFFQRFLSEDRMDKVNSWFKKYGHWTCGILRFTPGLRFPGHLSCGITDVPLHKFILIDGAAALLSIPTQIYFIAEYGEEILAKIREFKIALGITILVLLVVYAVYRLVKFIHRKYKPSKI